MNNKYFVLRHGKSSPNEKGAILSDSVESLKKEHGLISEGRDQVTRSIEQAKQEKVIDNQTLIISSPFSRALETAEIAKKVLCTTSIEKDERLRERYFGDWENTHNSNYEKVWEKDRLNPDHTEHGVESATTVQQRTMSLINDLEARFSGKDILLVSHGDALQILQTGLQNLSASFHRDMPHLEVAEIRRLA